MENSESKKKPKSRKVIRRKNRRDIRKRESTEIENIGELGR